MADVFAQKLDQVLRNHLQGIELQRLSRIDASRLKARAIPNIGLIELVDSETFSAKYDALYVEAFPRRTERENSQLIATRLAAQFAEERRGLAPYHIVGIRDVEGEAIGAAQFSVLPLRDSKFAVPYLQYIYVREKNRRQDMSEVLHTLMVAVATADAEHMGGRVVPLTLFETEPPGYGDDDAARAFSVARAQVHTKGGAIAIVLERNGEQISPHVQPGLEEHDPPLSLIWTVRPNPASQMEWSIQELGHDLMAAYYQSLRDEGFPEENIKVAENMVEERARCSTWNLTPLDQLRCHTTQACIP